MKIKGHVGADNEKVCTINELKKDSAGIGQEVLNKSLKERRSNLNFFYVFIF